MKSDRPTTVRAGAIRLRGHAGRWLTLGIGWCVALLWIPHVPRAARAAPADLAEPAPAASSARPTSSAAPLGIGRPAANGAAASSARPASSAPPAGSARPASRVAPIASSAATSLTSAMNQVAARVAAEIAAESKQAVVCAAELRSDEAAPRGADLAGKLAQIVAGKLPGAVAKVEPVSLATAQAVARRGKALVYLQTEIAAGQLRITADVYPATQNLWERVREPVPAPVGHAFAAARVDGEVRAYLAPVPLVGARIDRATIEDKEVVALACGDVDGDGAVEIVALSRRRIALGRARGGRFVAHRTVLLRDLSGIAPAPLREPLGGVAIATSRSGSPRIDVGITDRARGSRLDGDLKLIGAIRGIPFATPEGDACFSIDSPTWATSVAKCTDADLLTSTFDLAPSIDAIATAVYVDAQGTARTAVATRDPRSGEIALQSGDRTATLARSGAQLALADLDQDGAPEIVTTLDVLPKPQGGVDDALIVTTWEADGTLREKSRTQVPTGVRAVAACPPERGAGAVVMATPGELWIVR